LKMGGMMEDFTAQDWKDNNDMYKWDIVEAAEEFFNDVAENGLNCDAAEVFFDKMATAKKEYGKEDE